MADEIDTSGAADETEDVAEEVEETEPDVEAAADETEETEAEPEKPAPKVKAAPPRTYKAKVRGKDIDLPADQVDALAKALDIDPQAILRGTQTFKAGQEALRQAAEKEKAAAGIKDALTKDTRRALKDAGLTDDQIAQFGVQLVSELMESEKLTPEQRRIRELEAEQAKVKAEKDAQTKTAEEAEAAEYEEKAAEKIQAEIKGALESGKLPLDPYIVKRLAAAMADHLDTTNDDPDDLSINDFVPLVMEEARKEHETFLGKLSGEDIQRMFPETYEKVRKHTVERVSGRRTVPVQTEGKTRKASTKQFTSIGALLRDF